LLSFGSPPHALLGPPPVELFLFFFFLVVFFSGILFLGIFAVLRSYKQVGRDIFPRRRPSLFVVLIATLRSAGRHSVL